jgi:hypothetical protein
MAQPIASP